MIQHRTIATNNIRMHIAEAGEGPLVILCHGFPELWYSWRHQLTALAEAGFHAVAPDQRGYGQTSQPEPIEAYTMLQLAGDITGLVYALGEEKAFIVGHDWGAPVASHCALLRPDIFQGIALLSVPYSPRGITAFKPTDLMRRMAGDRQFYMLYFQEPGRAEAEMEVNVRESLLRLYYAASGAPPPEKRWRFIFEKDETLLDSVPLPESLPEFLTADELDFYTAEFERTGFRGGLNWYRTIDLTWEQTAFLANAKITQPAVFAAGEHDAVIQMSQRAFQRLEENMPGLRQKVLLPGAGHWVQQERPAEINDLLISFFREFS